ncbi:conserved hypothetical protein [Streptomyces sp. SPB78]|uniref:DUF6919 domain-containing protein n=1 Tax=Streptomyces sp. (strain SPB78) TaxID=591157 RepID=UPI0001B54A1A|nr:hypothetical protein [Streptomyces sp. SPB78]EFL04296.1 conserved hypothetical protein [Streptomyces sp. SPB78]
MRWSTRRQWRTARTLPDLGLLMARWLEGTLPARPGHAPGPVDEETAPLVPALAALCRTGVLTLQSQPGIVGLGADGQMWRQRAFVQLLATPETAADLEERARGFLVLRDGDDGLPVTMRGAEAVTWCGRPLSPAERRAEVSGAHPAAVRAVQAATHLTVVAPEYGPDGDRLFTALTSN